ncbi:hypothetical protein Maq22A_1p38585 (plasmid) [Methylobacterium aquaticum]|uniref:Uncharacterized protein n=1 Tax=Methylobacterium aquaticum TaxID=270351 RepID=A0A1Y0ZH50_9HYPH|nr:hypothetical protein Maq22A_1p38585 [Methylobacterium aquaticum]
MLRRSGRSKTNSAMAPLPRRQGTAMPTTALRCVPTARAAALPPVGEWGATPDRLEALAAAGRSCLPRAVAWRPA